MIALRAIRDGWNRFFFEPESPLPIAVYRILLGLLLVANHLLLLPDLETWFGENGMLSPKTAWNVPGGQGLNLFQWLGNSDAAVWTVYWLALLSAMALAAGLATRLSAILAFLTLVTLHHRNPVLLNSGDSFLRIAMFFVMFSHAGAALSVDRWFRVKRGKEHPGRIEPRAPWAMRLIQLQLAFLYFYAFVWKMMGSLWVQGTAVYYTSRLPEFWRFPLPYVFEHMWTIKIWTWATLVIEFSMGVLVWVRELRYWVLLAGVLLHLGIDYTMNIPLFGPTMIAAYITFVEPRRIQQALDWMKSRMRRIPVLRGWIQETPAPQPTRQRESPVAAE